MSRGKINMMNKYLCYTLVTCEMGSEGYSQYAEFQILEGETAEEIISKYNKRSIDEIRESEISYDDYGNFTYNDYFVEYFILLPEGTDVYGHVRPMKLEFPVKMHDDDDSTLFEEKVKYNLTYYKK